MKTYETKKVARMVLKSVTCDRCGDGCKNTHIDILCRFSFCEKPDFIETVCFDCWEKEYKKKRDESHQKKVDFVKQKKG